MHDEELVSRRMWAAIMLTPWIDVCESILLGRPVMIRSLDRAVLRRALRGAPPPEGEWITISPEMLDAIAEGGRFRGA